MPVFNDLRYLIHTDPVEALIRWYVLCLYIDLLTHWQPCLSLSVISDFCVSQAFAVYRCDPHLKLCRKLKRTHHPSLKKLGINDKRSGNSLVTLRIRMRLSRRR